MSRIDTVETEVFMFNELSEESKEAALAKLYDLNIDHDWWSMTYEDAANAHLDIDSFDLDRHSITGSFKASPEDTAEKIISEHGKGCDTLATAREYMANRAKLVEKYSDGIQKDIVAEDNEYDFDYECDELDSDFNQSILEDYRIMLSHEFEYLTSEEAIVETINANAYEFEADGTLY
jgi:hypothetical protein